MKTVLISREPLELYKLLKFEALVASGGEAKAAISEGCVQVNGEVETRKRRKLLAGDVVEFQQQKLRLALQETADPEPRQ